MTAGHCFTSQSEHEFNDQSLYCVRSPQWDCAFVKIRLSDAYNQAYVNTGGYEEFMESMEEFPYIDVNTVEPGTDIL